MSGANLLSGAVLVVLGPSVAVGVLAALLDGAVWHALLASLPFALAMTAVTFVVGALEGRRHG